MQNSKKHDPKQSNTPKTNTKLQEKGIPKADPGTIARLYALAPHVNPTKAKSADTSKPVSHQDEYRKDHPKAGAGVKNPATPVLK